MAQYKSGFPVGLAADPRSPGVAAPIGTVGRDPNGFLYLKVGAGDSDWILLEAWKYVTCAVPATTVSFTGLDGDKDVAYDILVALKFNSGAASIDVRPNSQTANRRRVAVFASASSVAASAATDWAVIDTQGGGTHSFMRATLLARRGAGGRSILASGMEAIGVSSAPNFINENGIWNDDTINITGIDFVSSLASGIGAGSFFAIKPLGLAR